MSVCRVIECLWCSVDVQRLARQPSLRTVYAERNGDVGNIERQEHHQPEDEAKQGPTGRRQGDASQGALGPVARSAASGATWSRKCGRGMRTTLTGTFAPATIESTLASLRRRSSLPRR